MADRKVFNVYLNAEETDAHHISVFFPEIGNLTITLENRSYHYEGNVDNPNDFRPVLSFDFDTKLVDITDRNGNDLEIK